MSSTKMMPADTMVEGDGEAHEASTLHKELWATGECWEWERRFAPGKSISDGCPILKGQPETIHTRSTVQTGQVVLTDSERQTHTVTADEERGHEWGVCGKGFGRRKGRGRWCNGTQKIKKYFNNKATIPFLLDYISLKVEAHRFRQIYKFVFYSVNHKCIQ